MSDDLTAVSIRVESDDHGHATLLVHGEPDIIAMVATAVTLLLAAEAEHIIMPDGDENDYASEPDEDLAESA